MITELNLPLANLKLSKKDCDLYIWCVIRKKNLLLTSEEWVRQHIIHFLIEQKKYPIGVIAAEMNLKVNKLSKRCDIVVFNQLGEPKIIIECKAPEVKITKETFYQVARYQSKLQVDYLMMSNGLDHYVCKIDPKTAEVEYLNELPEWIGIR